MRKFLSQKLRITFSATAKSIFARGVTMDYDFLKPDQGLVDKIFDQLPKDKEGSWERALATVCQLAVNIFMAGDSSKGKKFEMFVAYPECKIRENKEYKITIEEVSQ